MTKNLKTPKKQNPSSNYYNKILFSHIPKTAGTAIREELLETLGEGNVLWLGIDFGYEDIEKPTKKMTDAKVIGGHYPLFGFPSVITDDRLKCSIIREPISRVKSLFNYIKVSDHHPYHERAKNLTLLQALETMEEFYGECINIQCSFLGDYIKKDVFTNTAEPIIEKIIENEIFISTVANINNFYKKISRVLDINHNKVRKANKVKYSKDVYLETDDNKKAEEIIRKINWEDNQLYNFVTGYEASEMNNIKLQKQIGLMYINA